MESGQNKGPGEVSFSSYLKTAEGNILQKLTDSAAYAINSSPEFPSSRSLHRMKADQGGEIGVFGAESYYNVKLEEGPIIIDTACKHSQVDLLHSKTKSRPGTPSVSSEASWNSQSGLLRTYQRNPSRGSSRQEKLPGKGFFSGLSCGGSCTDKKSVYINQNVELGGLVHGIGYKKEIIQSSARNPVMLDGRKQLQQAKFKVKDEFLATQIAKFSVANSGVPNLAVQKMLAKKVEEEDPRKSLDVFGSHALKKEVIEKNLERKLSMLSWDAIPKTPGLQTSCVRSQEYEDADSDASSDLFEIENISGSSGTGQGQQPVFRRRQLYEDDGMSSSCPYEPSETSIDWSVVTASAADYSVVPDYDEKNLTENIRTAAATARPATASNKIVKNKSGDKDGHAGQGSLPSKLLGCNSNKAVGVAESAHIINNRAKPHPHSQQPLRSVAPMPASKVKADNSELVFDFP